LRVHGEVRQNMIVEGDILYSPVQALQTLAKFQKLEAGDLVLTGTPVGTALTARGIENPSQMDLKTFLAGQTQNPNYLHHGDVVEATVATDDGAINLGTQRNKVVYA
jgi:2-keto-4-pentenoate hydratase/2-oxohepta-3-ene-1,7-dioic acid hydratase in catechol pathway